ncbi:HEAT repeat domain-containing protein [Bacillus changyiensis]|uniref:HEAT repeat domain-containing protein n=1 Tax=Bacillus changyiensis TaxID=3004103 RepID=UPI0022E0727C|nr:HEAT repeat domain-containing protein [Bacillus changyiensis]MDA1477982.1 HEAT repeat domain-containing protein [Bacillus changyiensis]
MESNENLSQSVKDLVHKNEVTIVKAIGELKESGQPAIPILIEALKEEGSLRNIAAAVLGEFGSEASEAAPALAALLKSESEDTRMAAALSLMRIGHGSLPSLLDVARNTEGPPCFWASWAISWIEPSKIDRHMYACLKDVQENSSEMVAPFAAEEAIGKIIAMQLKNK